MWRNNSLSIVFAVLFGLSLVGHAVSGWKDHNEDQRDHGQPEATLAEFLRTPDFGETIFENWESEFLQMAAYVVLTIFLRQKGSSESRKIDEPEEEDEDPELHRNDKSAPWPVRAGGLWLKLYKHSLGLTFAVLFVVSFILHAAAGARLYNEEKREHGSPLHATTLQYMVKPKFWYESFQNWQSEFLSVLCVVVFSIWLREYGSPESKPVHASHEDTGR